MVILYNNMNVTVLKADITLMIGSSETWPETRQTRFAATFQGLPCFFLPSKFPDLSKKKIGVKILEILGVFPKLLNQNVLNQHVQEKSPSTFQPLNLVWIYIELRLFVPVDQLR